MKKDRKRTVEILAPAGSVECAGAALKAGADAIYVGGSKFGARAYADNPQEEELLELIDEVHLHGRKIYLTVNTLIKDRELPELYDYLLPYYRQGLDAVIMQDVGAMQYVRRHFPKLPLHVSTQATVTNVRGARFFGELGADRIVPARELSLEEIRKMKEGSGLEIECFVHGAMCYCYSGQCLLSSMIGGRSGNRGQCAQPCRLPYSVNGRKPQDILSLKDLCTIELLPDLIDAGIDSFKIEGRMKQPEYVYTVTSMYRKYVDIYLTQGREGFHVSDEDRRTLEGAYRRRGYADGYYNRQNGKEMISFHRPEEKKEETFNILDYKIKEKINGKLILSEGKHAKLSVEYQKGKKACCAEVAGEPVQTAQKAPLEPGRIEKQMRKTGNTDFVFENLEIQIDGEIFLPMQALNEMRRTALHVLRNHIVSSYRREDALNEPCPVEKTVTADVVSEFQALIQTISQLDAVCEFGQVDTLYIDGNIAFDKSVLALAQGIREENTKVYAAMPYIFRERGIAVYEPLYKVLEEHYDGVLIRNWESYEWLKEKGYDKSIIADYNLYVMNRESQKFLEEKEMDAYTSSPELHYRELQGLGGNGISIVYGHQPVMITANCINKNTSGCKGEEKVTWLTDRYQKKFAVKNDCKCCYNVMYNCAPLLLADLAEEIKALFPAGIRLDFTIEDKRKTGEMLRLYRRAFSEGKMVELPDIEYTRGHFKRGVK